jgi:signal transduction histidine kinase
LQVTAAKVRNNDDPFLAGAMDKANVQVKRMSGMINSFLNVSRLETGNIILEKLEFRLDELLRDVVDELQPTAPDHHMHLADCAVSVFADREKIGSVISNLLSNAIKYSPKGTTIELNCYDEKDLVRVSIKDEGMGVPAQDLERLFERYYRVESSNTMHISGFGIGLYLSSEIVKQHGGRIWAESQPGMGSTFHFTLPVNAP